MSGKSSKKLRKIALGLASVLDEDGIHIENRELLVREYHAPNSTKEAPIVVAVTAVNRPNSLRGIIRNLKRGMKSGELSKPIVARDQLQSS